MLLMKKRFFDAIRRGAKTTTLRLWDRRRVRPGAVHTVPGLGRVRIDAVRVVRLDELTDAEVAADGFTNRHDLRATLTEIYATDPDRPADGRKLYAVHFTLLADGAA